MGVGRLTHRCMHRAGIVLFWLLRQEPFTGLARELQGGHFDHADRYFRCLVVCQLSVV